MNANESKRLDDFHADMVAMAMEDTVDMMEVESRDWSPVPVEYWNMSYAEVCEDIADYAMATFLAEQARNQIPYRWQ